MKPHWRLDFRHPRNLALFGLAIGAVILVWRHLPPALQQEFLRNQPRRTMNPVAVMFTVWLTGWFGLLFVKMEDLNVLAPINYQAGLRFVAVLFIATAVIIAALILAVI